MVIVFAGFILTIYVVTREIGFALAAVILIGAAVTRRLLVPAALRLLSDRAWTRARPRRAAPPWVARQPAAPRL